MKQRANRSLAAEQEGGGKRRPKSDHEALVWFDGGKALEALAASEAPGVLSPGALASRDNGVDGAARHAGVSKAVPPVGAAVIVEVKRHGYGDAKADDDGDGR